MNCFLSINCTIGRSFSKLCIEEIFDQKKYIKNCTFYMDTMDRNETPHRTQKWNAQTLAKHVVLSIYFITAW